MDNSNKTVEKNEVKMIKVSDHQRTKTGTFKTVLGCSQYVFIYNIDKKRKMSITKHCSENDANSFKEHLKNSSSKNTKNIKKTKKEN